MDYVIPANDDAIRAVKLVTWVMANAVVEANGGAVEKFSEPEEVNLSEEISKDKGTPVNKDIKKKAPAKKPAAKKPAVKKPEEVKADAE